MVDSPNDGWTAGFTCTIAYFNACSGFVWLWSGFEDDTELGMVFERCCTPNSFLSLLQTVHWNGAPSGYGFTGVAEVYVDSNGNCCPEPNESVAIQAYLPSTGWNSFTWMCGPIKMD